VGAGEVVVVALPDGVPVPGAVADPVAVRRAVPVTVSVARRPDALTDPDTDRVLDCVIERDPEDVVEAVRVPAVDRVSVPQAVGVAERLVLAVSVTLRLAVPVTMIEAVDDLVPIADREFVGLDVPVLEADTDRVTAGVDVDVRLWVVEPVEVALMREVLVGRTDTEELGLAVPVFDALILCVVVVVAVVVELPFALLEPVPVAVALLETDVEAVPVLEDVVVRVVVVEPVIVFVLVCVEVSWALAVPVLLLVVVDDPMAVRRGVLDLALVAEAAAEGKDERDSVDVFVEVLDAEEDRLTTTGLPISPRWPRGSTSIDSFDIVLCSVKSSRLRRNIAFVHIWM
jgi:hypothetical protein